MLRFPPRFFPASPHFSFPLAAGREIPASLPSGLLAPLAVPGCRLLSVVLPHLLVGRFGDVHLGPLALHHFEELQLLALLRGEVAYDRLELAPLA